jgi:formylglycine-generating enzyme required for sulfatase activity
MTQKSDHIFISYAREDRGRIEVLAELLHAGGWQVWWDRKNLPAGQQFHRVIDQAIGEAGCVLVCWSNAAIDSDWVLDEANEAKKQGKLLPVLLEEVSPPYGFRSYHYVDFSRWDQRVNHEAFQILLQELNNKSLNKARGTPTGSEDDDQVTRNTSIVETKTLLERLESPDLSPEEKLGAGDLLAINGDPRPGVGLVSDGTPDIDWVEVPGGVFLFGETRQTSQIDSFYISRFPITNTQYQAFIADGGYDDELWREDLSGWRTEPGTSVWAQGNRPRSFVNWYESIAYCRWLSYKLGFHVTLPTEQQWERAARGNDGRDFPWGNAYHGGFANVDELENNSGRYQLNQPSTVGMYPMGASLEGVLDMAGNVWEWMLNDHANPENLSEEGNQRRALRGGAWNREPGFARASLRMGYLPYRRYGNLGFRVACAQVV